MIKVLEGQNLNALIEKAKSEFGENVEILYYEIEKSRELIPFFRKKRYRLYVKEKEERTEPLEELRKEIAELKSLMKTVNISSEKSLPSHIKPSISEEALENFTGDAVELISKLVEKGVSKDIAARVIEKSCGIDIDTNKLDLNTQTFREAIEKGVKSLIRFTGEFEPEGEQKVIAFVGPTGVGKTTNLFKLAARFLLNRNLKVGVISTDTFKVGAIQQARTYANILNVPFFTVTDPKKMKETLRKIKDLDIILIDTVGRSHYDYWRLGEIRSILDGGNFKAVLLISCNMKQDESIEVVNRYRSFFPIHSILFTKIDETAKPGLIIDLPIITDLPVSYISTGQRVPEDIKVLTPQLIADYMLGEI